MQVASRSTVTCVTCECHQELRHQANLYMSFTALGIVATVVSLIESWWSSA